MATFWKVVWPCFKRYTVLDLLTGIYMDQEIERRMKIVYKDANFCDVYEK